MKRIALALSALTLGAAALGVPAVVSAWGNTGHRMVGMAAVRALPDELPAFLRTPGAAAEVGELSREPDRTKGGGQPHDRERDTAHFIDMDDDGHVLNGQGLSIDALPVLKSEYDAALAAAGIDVDDAGYLPYAIMDGYQQLVRDFATWRVLNAAEARESDPGKRAWYREDRLRREALILRDMGYLSHYVGDGSQPLHTSIHYNGWGSYPNPEGFTNSRQTHGSFEGAFVRRTVRLDAVEAAMPAPRLDGFDLRLRVPAYLKASLAETIPFYRLEKAGGFVETDARGGTFATARLAAGAAELRDLTVLAWRASAEVSIGWPAVKVAEVEAGTADPWLAMIGED
ncbi:S1/P1 Nuclease [uncultured Brevundimonas sp.]|uniref:S1/P1 Nuclease n=1 Tax=uncultured Brevundimonas sp. TaxID=213418 RepID=UPI0030EB62C1|tara:strand:+ start:21427 stop:22455 length:1029 start_codon:yes stop_codon:yes gene_type:complete